MTDWLLYDVNGYPRPLRLSPEHAEVLGATPHAVPAQAPGNRASKAEWVDYALGQGADAATVDGLTRAQLIASYGG